MGTSRGSDEAQQTSQKGNRHKMDFYTGRGRKEVK